MRHLRRVNGLFCRTQRLRDNLTSKHSAYRSLDRCALKEIIAQLPDIQNPYELFDSMMKRPCGADNLAQACLLSFRTS